MRASRRVVDPRGPVGSPALVPYLLAHHHMLGVVHSELPPDARSVSILDVGCGDGRLIAFMHRMLRRYRPDLEVSIHGFDVADSSIQEAGFFEATRAFLEREIPDVDWRARLRMIRSVDRWPYADGSFDWVISNQVLEHVRDQAFVLSEIARVLKPGGRSAHLFPVRENVLEGHIHIPGSHWIRDPARLRRYIRFMTALGIGSYRRIRREEPHLDAATYAATRADYLLRETHYTGKAEVRRLAARASLRCSFRYTEHFYWNKLRSLLRLPFTHRLRPVSPGLLHGFAVSALSRVSCVTAFLEKPGTRGAEAQRLTARSTES